MPNPKPSLQIEIWRTEVSNYTPTPASPSTSSQPSTSLQNINPNPPAFWKKYINRSSSSSASNQGQATNSPDPPLTTSSSPTKTFKERIKRKMKSEEEGELEGVRTQMYDGPLHLIDEHGHEGRGSMDAGDSEDVDVDVDEESEDDLLKQKRERLERAARLLNGPKKGEGKRSVDGGEAR
jgi:hypothetical protein